jgi:sulfate permease, SulP family
VRTPTVFPSLRGYRAGWLRSDLVAGLTVWAVLVPESLAYASIAGVSPVIGLYAAPPALVLYAVFGSSRHLVVGPMSATAALSAAAVADVVTPDGNAAALTAALAVVTGLVAVTAGLLRLGFLAGFISEPVLKGFIIGLALTILAGQLPKLFGVEKGEGNFFEELWDLVTRLGDTDGWTFAIGLSSLVIVLAMKRYVPLLPAALVAVVYGVLAAVLLDLDAKGVALVGSISSGLPSLGLPDVAFGDYLALAAGAVGIALVGFAEGLGAAKTYAAKTGYDIDANRELVGLGAANLGSGLSSGMVVNGSLSKTAVNGGAGARSQVSGLVVAALTVVTLLFLTGLFEQLPEATLGAVVIAAVVDLVDLPAVTALLGVLLFDTLPGLFLGIGVSVLLMLYRSSRPNVAVLGRAAGEAELWVDRARYPDVTAEPGVLVARVESGLFFANADHVRQRIRELVRTETARAVVLDCETVPSVDVTAAQMLVELSQDLERDGVTLLVARDIGQVRDLLERAGADGVLTRVYRTVSSAVAAARESL